MQEIVLIDNPGTWDSWAWLRRRVSEHEWPEDPLMFWGPAPWPVWTWGQVVLSIVEFSGVLIARTDLWPVDAAEWRVVMDRAHLAGWILAVPTVNWPQFLPVLPFRGIVPTRTDSP